MRTIIALLFILSILILAFLGLNHLWNWVDIIYTKVIKGFISAVIAVFAFTGIAIVRYTAYHKNPQHPNVGKKSK